MPSLAPFIDPTRSFDGKESSDLVPFVFEPTAESDQRAHAACDDRVETILGQHEGAADGKDAGVEPEFLDDVFGDLSFFRDAIAQGDIEVWAEDGQKDPWNAAPGTEIEDFFVGLKEFANLVAIEQIALDEEFRSGVSREIDFGVPVPGHLAVHREFSPGWIVDRLDPQIPSQTLEIIGRRGGRRLMGFRCF